MNPRQYGQRILQIGQGKIVALLARGEAAEAAAVVDVHEKVLSPGLVDAHVHFREAGMTWKEDFGSGTRAAMAESQLL